MNTNDNNQPMQESKQAVYQLYDAYGKDSLNHDDILIDCFKMRLNKSLLERIDFTTLAFISTEFIIDDELVRYQSDIICRFSIDNKSAVIYFIIELQSTPDRHMADRLDEYALLLTRKHKKGDQTKMRPFILPICMYNGQVAYPYSTYLYACVTSPDLAKEYGRLDGFELWDLTQHTIDELLQQGGKSGLFQALLKQGKCGEFLEVLQKVTPAYIQQLPRSHVRNSAVYIYHKSKPEQGAECLRLLSELIREKTVKEDVMSYADSLRYQGVEEGKQLGMKKGKQLGMKEGKQLGIEEGVTRGILQTAKNLLRQGVEMGTILLATGLQREQLLQLQEQRC
ncbi:MAG: Rpn family recombination-promoting nuclease/putative transposase [Bacteroidota bacterium]